MEITKKQAKELSIKKWEYIIDNGSLYGLLNKYPELANLDCCCGYCEKYSASDCRNCPLNFKGIICSKEAHPWDKWFNNQTKSNAQKVLDLIKKS